MTTKVDFGNQAEIPSVENRESATSSHSSLPILFSKVRQFAFDHFAEVVCVAFALVTAYLMPITFMVSFSIGFSLFVAGEKGKRMISDGTQQLISTGGSLSNAIQKIINGAVKGIAAAEGVEADSRDFTFEEMTDKLYDKSNKNFHRAQDKKDMWTQIGFAILTSFFVASRFLPGFFSCLSGLDFGRWTFSKYKQYLSS